jgi:UDP-N-acetylmuramoyl-tripeptide--D-alanyl-D-alanine ligase
MSRHGGGAAGRLGDVARVAGAAVPPGADARRPVAGYSIDSRTIRPGELFVAVRGDRFDGADFVLAALERGAAGALVGEEAWRERAAAAPPGAAVLVVPDPRAALQALAADHRARHAVPVVAITGTNGKTTTKEVVAHALAAHLRVCASEGNLNSQLGLPLMLLNRLGPEDRVGVFEVGMSAPGEIARLCRVLAPDRGVVTNVGTAHTEFLGSLDNVYAAKSELVSALPAGHGRLYLNAECAFHGRMRAAHAGPARRVSVADRTADLFLDVGSVDLSGLEGTLAVAGRPGRHALRLPIPGLHMAYPALFAVAVALDLDLDLATTLSAIAGCRAARHRMQVEARDGLTVLDDCYNANPPSTEALLAFVRSVPYTRGRKLVVLGDMLELGALADGAHRNVAERALAAPELARLFLVGPLYRRAVETSPDLREGAAAGRLVSADSREAVLPLLAGALARGDLLVLKASRGIGLDWLLDRL